MAKRTFKGFLKEYCRELSGLETASLRRLMVKADSDAPRVAEPLFCLACEEGKLDYLLKNARGTWMESQWEELAPGAMKYKDTRTWLEECKEVPDRYAQVLSAYESQWDLLNADRRMNALMRERTLRALSRTGMTRYQLSKRLGINKGNLYAYLNGDDSKVGKQTARKIMEFAERAL